MTARHANAQVSAAAVASSPGRAAERTSQARSASGWSVESTWYRSRRAALIPGADAVLAAAGDHTIPGQPACSAISWRKLIARAAPRRTVTGLLEQSDGRVVADDVGEPSRAQHQSELEARHPEDRYRPWP